MAYRVCFVCTGNICRSPTAESVFRARVAEDGLDGVVEAESAGTDGWHEGDGADPRTVAVLEENGYASDHTARRFDPSWFARLDLVIALDTGHLRTLRRLAPPRGTRTRCACCARTTPKRVTIWTYRTLTTGRWTAFTHVLRWWRRRAPGCSPRYVSRRRDGRHERFEDDQRLRDGRGGNVSR